MVPFAAPFLHIGNGGILMENKTKYISSDNRIKDIISDIQNIEYTHGISTVFADYITLASCAVSNTVEKLHFDEQETLYMNMIKKYI